MSRSSVLPGAVFVIVASICGAIYAKPGDVDPDFGVGCGPPVKFPPLIDLAIGPDAKIYAIGRGLVARCLAGGGADATFAGSGFGAYVPPIAFDFRAGAVAPDGRVVVAGVAATATGVGVMRLDANGLPDQSYGVYADKSAPTLDASAATSAMWTRTVPDLLDIDLVDLKSLVRTRNADGTTSGGAEWLDPTLPGWDPTLKGPNGLPLAIHYGDMAGGLPGPQGPDDYSLKLSNGSCPPKWGVEANGLHYLESCTDGTKEPLPQSGGCLTCRLIDWDIGRFSFPELYYRFMVYAYPESLANQTELGIKLTGLGGKLDNGGTFAEIFEIGKKTSTGWPLQAYRFDAEGAQGVTKFPQAGELVPGKWYTMEGHVKVPSAIGVKDGVMEYKLDGKLVFSRTDVDMGASSIQGFGVQLYHGGTTNPAGVLRYKTARIALSRKGWIGPAPELTEVSAIAALADGKVVVAGTSGPGAFLMRFTESGTLDSSFGVGGIARPSSASFDIVNGLLLQRDGKLLVLGARRSAPPIYSVLALARFNADGSPDASFGTNGMVSVDFRPTHNSSAFSAAQSADGRIVVAGVVEADALESAKVALARLAADGTIDASFGYAGKVLHELSGVRRTALSLSPDGNIIAVASANPSYVLRFTASGAIDATFGLGGKTQVPSLASDAYAGTQPGGKVVIGSSGSLGFTISRYLIDGQASRTELKSMPNPSRLGQPVTLTATVTGQSPTGPVQFAELGVAVPGCGSVPVVAAVATCSFVPGSDGAHTLSASYAGDSANPPSQSIDVQHIVSPAGTAAAIEFYDATFDSYFVTANPDEVASLDDGTIDGWQRTGVFFSVWPLAAPATQPVCRFFSGQKFAPKSSHFYTPYAAECTTTRASADWIYEGDVMGWRLPDPSGSCATGERPLYRAYNNGQGSAPHHRYYTAAGLHAEMRLRGWLVEGNGPNQVFACVP